MTRDFLDYTYPSRCDWYSEPFPCSSSGENSRYSGGFRRAGSRNAAPPSEADPDLRQRGVQNERRQKRHSRKRGHRTLCRICDHEERWNEDQALSDDGSGPDDTVEFGLQRVLDGVEALVLARSTQPESRWPGRLLFEPTS